MFTATHIFDPEPPYDFNASAGFAVYGRDRYAADSLIDSVFSRALEINRKTVALNVRSLGEIEKPRIEVRLQGDSLTSEEESKITRTAVRLVGAHGNLTEFYNAIESDDPLAKLLNQFRGLGVAQSPSPFEGLTHSILGQQISNEVARALRNLLVDTLGKAISINGVEYKTFPSPDTIAEAGIAKLRRMKLSVRKAEYISDIAKSVASGTLDLNALAALPDNSIVKELVKLRGVGPWTAHWALIRAFDRPDGFPEGDLALQRSLGTLYNGGKRLTADEAVALSARWRPYRSYIVTYIFAASRQDMIQPTRP